MKRVLAVALMLSLVASATASANPKRAYMFETYANNTADVGGRAIPTVPYSTGFEAGDGFALGPVEPQANWSASFVNNGWASVSGAHPSSGSQHLRTVWPGIIAPNTAVATGSYFAKHGDFGGPTLGNLPAIVSADISISAGLATNYSMVAGHLLANGSTQFVGRLYFYAGDYDYDYVYNDVLALGSTGCSAATAAFTVIGEFGSDAGTYHNWRMELDPNAGTCGEIKYYKDNVLVHTGNFPFPDVNSHDANTVGMSRLTLATNDGSVGDMDNASITPEPGSLALLGLGALALIRRRR